MGSGNGSREWRDIAAAIAAEQAWERALRSRIKRRRRFQAPLTSRATRTQREWNGQMAVPRGEEAG